MNRPIAQFLSAAFHPLLLPTYLFYVVCYQLPGIVQHPVLPERWRLLGVVVLFTFVLPVAGTALLLWLGVVKGNLELRERQQRPLPLLLAMGSFGVAAVLFSSTLQAVDALLRHMMTGMTLAILLTLLVSLRWKISAHGMGVGGAVGLLVVLARSNPGTMAIWWWLAASVVVAGAVLHARLVLDAHTPAQVQAGFALGVVLVFGLGAALV